MLVLGAGRSLFWGLTGKGVLISSDRLLLVDFGALEEVVLGGLFGFGELNADFFLSCLADISG